MKKSYIVFWFDTTQNKLMSQVYYTEHDANHIADIINSNKVWYMKNATITVVE